eukprot:TRINITY_DN4621_c0_g1_i1.p1 TRINITY_DN4621_c0_g1~~TRINITY_DN4621_c0_g1_i1.p1  ORF type:complete len:458 (+),score=78.99 TRINITY_DN4621_c0_g1_i1:153-1526(+)
MGIRCFALSSGEVIGVNDHLTLLVERRCDILHCFDINSGIYEKHLFAYVPSKYLFLFQHVVKFRELYLGLKFGLPGMTEFDDLILSFECHDKRTLISKCGFASICKVNERFMDLDYNNINSGQQIKFRVLIHDLPLNFEPLMKLFEANSEERVSIVIPLQISNSHCTEKIDFKAILKTAAINTAPKECLCFIQEISTSGMDKSILSSESTSTVYFVSLFNEGETILSDVIRVTNGTNGKGHNVSSIEWSMTLDSQSRSVYVSNGCDGDVQEFNSDFLPVSEYFAPLVESLIELKSFESHFCEELHKIQKHKLIQLDKRPYLQSSKTAVSRKFGSEEVVATLPNFQPIQKVEEPKLEIVEDKTIEGVGRFCCYDDKLIHCIFIDGTSIKLFPTSTSEDLYLEGTLPDSPNILSDPMFFESYIPSIISFKKWCFMSPSERLDSQRKNEEIRLVINQIRL